MFRSRAPHAAAGGLALLLALAVSTPALAGPPWIAVEYPANPHDRTTRGALLLVHTYHHGDAITAPVSGTAEGLVNGRRQSLPLEVAPTSRPGVYAVRVPQRPAGSWMLVVTLRQGQQSTATALVTMEGSGEVAGVQVPSRRTSDGWTVPLPVGEREIESALRAHAARQTLAAAPGATPGPDLPRDARLGLLGLLPLGGLALAWRLRGRGERSQG